MKKKHDDSQSNDSKKQRGRPKKHKPLFKLFAKNCWPKLMISHGYTFREKGVDSSGTSDFSCLEGSAGKLRFNEEKVGCDVEHLCCDENGPNFEEEQSVCLISSSSEIEENHKRCETVENSEKRLTSLDGPVEEDGFDFSTEESAISETGDQDRPIFVDLTADEKKPCKQMILQPCYDVIAGKKREVEREEYTVRVVPEHQIMIADSSSKVHCNRNSSLATALRDRGPCLIPVQPNRSLPIRPVPSVPTRSFRKDCSSLFPLPKSSDLNIVGVESVKPIDMLSNELRKEEDMNTVEQMASTNTVTSVDYVVPQISNVKSLSGMKRRDSCNIGIEEDAVKENRKKKRSQEADSSQSKEECVESSIQEFLTNFCGSRTTTGLQNLCTDKCARIVSTSQEGNRNKVVPPLRLKKIVRTGTEGYRKSETTTGTEHELNYRIVTDNTPQPPCSSSSSNWNEMLYGKDREPPFPSTDSYKLKYRRNRLKQKLQELRGKSLELADQMTNDGNSQQNTRLRQVMNRYEKQIENLSKLHSKLSAARPVSKKATDGSDMNNSPRDDEYPFIKLNERNVGPINNNSPVSSPEPPKLSPRSPLNYANILEHDVRNSPPILPRVCMPVSLSQDSVDEEVQITEKKVWPVNEESMKTMHPADTLQADSENPVYSDLVKSTGNTSLARSDSISVDTESSDHSVNKRSSNHSKNVAQFPENNYAASEKNDETEGLSKEFPQCRFVIEKSEDIKSIEYSDPAPPATCPATDSLEVPVAVQGNEMLEIPSGKQIHPSTERQISQPDSYKVALEGGSFSKLNEGSSNAQKVTSSSGQPTQFNIANAVLNQENLASQQNYKGEETWSDTAQKNTDCHSLTEQFPTLGNWLARMSNRPTSKVKSKLKVVGNIPFGLAESATRVPGHEVSKAVGPNATNNTANTTPQCNKERWQCHNHQQQRQLLQHVASSVTLSQPVPAVPSLRPGICPPIPVTQYYPNNYAIDSYNSAALAYHPAIYPYGTYPYHSRLHSSPLPGYHFPIQDSLRPMHHMNKRFPSAHDRAVRYSSPATSTLQHQSNLELDRLRGNSVGNNVGSTTCLSPLFLPPPTLSPSHQALPRAPLLGHPTNNQFCRNRMVPDVVAAAAAAAVVAAASFDRQRDPLTYNRADTDALSTAGITNIVDGQPPLVPGSNKSVIAHRDVSNQARHGNFNEEGYESTKYQQMQNFLFDRLALVETADNFAQTNPIIGNDTTAPITSIVPTTPYRMPLVPSHAQLSTNVPRNESRSCETPHLGKINRSPNSLHNFTCSNCGIIGPKFKCLGCEMAFYCNERCQEEHWYVHVQKCPKKMPKLKKVT